MRRRWRAGTFQGDVSAADSLRANDGLLTLKLPEITLSRTPSSVSSGQGSLPNVPSAPRTQAILEIPSSQSSTDDEDASLVLRTAQPLHNLQSATKLMATQLGYTVPPDLPYGCCWMGVPPMPTADAQPASRMECATHPSFYFPGIIGGPLLFEELIPRIAELGAGAVSLSYSTDLLRSCAIWADLIHRCAEIVRQIITAAEGSTRPSSSSSGARDAVVRLIGYRLAAGLPTALEAS